MSIWKLKSVESKDGYAYYNVYRNGSLILREVLYPDACKFVDEKMEPSDRYQEESRGKLYCDQSYEEHMESVRKVEAYLRGE